MKTNLFEITPFDSQESYYVAAETSDEARKKLDGYYHQSLTTDSGGCLVECVGEIII